MVDIQSYINLSATATSINGILTNPKKFSEDFKNIYDSEKKSFLRHYIINNSPYLFKTNPILFEQLTQYLADKLEINPSGVKLIGSAKTGFSISNPPDYGKPFRPESDLDFSVINEDIFNSLEEEFKSWAIQYVDKSIFPKNDRSKVFWDNNLYEVPKYQLKNGFIDTYKIPNYTEFLVAQKINSALSLIVINLKTKYAIEVKGASARVYRSWNTFTKQLNLNTEKILTKVT